MNTYANPRQLRCVLAARLSALGDVAMTVPVLYSAARCYPEVRFVMLTRSSMAPIFVNPPSNLEAVGIDVSQYEGLRGLRRLYRELRQRFAFDAFVDLHDVLRTRVFDLYCRLGGIPVSVINKGRKGKRRLTRSNDKVLLPLISSRARYRQAFHALGLPVESRFDGLFASCPGGKAPAEMFAAICPPKAKGERWVGVAPFAQHPGKIYPLEMMLEVVKGLLEEPRVRVFLFGGGDEERQTLGQWATDLGPSVTSLAGKRYGFPAELALLSHLDVMISMDSANMHLASIVSTPVVSIWGATHPYCGFKGWRQAEADTLQLPMTCRPCSVFGNRPCFRGDYHCLRGIAPQLILDRARAHLQ